MSFLSTDKCTQNIDATQLCIMNVRDVLGRWLVWWRTRVTGI